MVMSGHFLAKGLCLVAAVWLAVAPTAARAKPAAREPEAKRLFNLQLDNPGERINLGLAYWIELIRDGKKYRCNNKFAFRSGDAMRIHVIPNTDGYAYIVLKGEGGASVLFPNSRSGVDNRVRGGYDYALPTTAMLRFDDQKGTERLSLILSRQTLNIKDYVEKSSPYGSAYVSAQESGAKDLVPTRIQLCWDDPAPVIMPGQFAGGKGSLSGKKESPGIARHSPEPAQASPGGLVIVVHEDPDGILAVDVALEHN